MSEEERKARVAEYSRRYRERQSPEARAERLAKQRAYNTRRYQDPVQRERHQERMAAWNQAHRAERTAYQRRRTRMKLYGVSDADVGTLLSQQDGACAVCRTPLTGDGQTHVDHDHATGLVRGLLCQECNLGLGHMRDDPKRLMAAAGYLVCHTLGLTDVRGY